MKVMLAMFVIVMTSLTVKAAVLMESDAIENGELWIVSAESASHFFRDIGVCPRIQPSYYYVGPAYECKVTAMQISITQRDDESTTAIIILKPILNGYGSSLPYDYYQNASMYLTPVQFSLAAFPINDSKGLELRGYSYQGINSGTSPDLIQIQIMNREQAQPAYQLLYAGKLIATGTFKITESK